MARALGIDLGGTKIEAQLFADDWSVRGRNRIDTPADYPALVASVAGQIAWGTERAGHPVPVGIGAAGLVSPVSGAALTANLAATGHPFPADIEAAAGRAVTYVNDCRAFTLSEAIFGVARAHSPVLGLLLGTGVGGGLAVDGALVAGPGQFGGEFGHIPAPAHLVARHGLPIVTCGCGRPGCIETFISGPGLARLAAHLTGQEVAPPAIAAGRRTQPALRQVWSVWRELVADLLWTLCMTVDPQTIVLGGGLSRIEGLAPELSEALARLVWPGYPAPAILIAEGGDSSGARGAAYAAWKAQP